MMKVNVEEISGVKKKVYVEIPEEEVDRFVHGESRGRGIDITTRLVRRMGGQIEVESSQGQTTFRVMLPLVT